MPNSPTSNVNKQRWMSKVPDIDRLKLIDLIWPGVHNAGMDKKAPNYDVIIGNWTTCQNDSFAWQLANGARAFDLRLGYRPGTPKGEYYFHHNGYQSHRVLDELIDAVAHAIEAIDSADELERILDELEESVSTRAKTGVKRGVGSGVFSIFDFARNWCFPEYLILFHSDLLRGAITRSQG